MTKSRTMLTLAALATGLWACSSGNSTTTQASVEFKLSAPLCGGLTPFGLTFLVDSVRVGDDSLHDASVSPPYAITPGSHRLSAILSNNPTKLALDTVAVIPADSVFVQTVGLYCS
jgi:hypothetical protein